MISTLAAVTSGISQVITWLGTVLSALVGENGALADLLPFFVISISIAVIFLAVKIVRSICWGA